MRLFLNKMPLTTLLSFTTMILCTGETMANWDAGYIVDQPYENYYVQPSYAVGGGYNSAPGGYAGEGYGYPYGYGQYEDCGSKGPLCPCQWSATAKGGVAFGFYAGRQENEIRSFVGIGEYSEATEILLETLTFQEDDVKTPKYRDQF